MRMQQYQRHRPPYLIKDLFNNNLANFQVNNYTSCLILQNHHSNTSQQNSINRSSKLHVCSVVNQQILTKHAQTIEINQLIKLLKRRIMRILLKVKASLPAGSYPTLICSPCLANTRLNRNEMGNLCCGLFMGADILNVAQPHQIQLIKSSQMITQKQHFVYTRRWKRSFTFAAMVKKSNQTTSDEKYLKKCAGELVNHH